MDRRLQRGWALWSHEGVLRRPPPPTSQGHPAHRCRVSCFPDTAYNVRLGITEPPGYSPSVHLTCDLLG